jgi:hypothetical protein
MHSSRSKPDGRNTIEESITEDARLAKLGYEQGLGGTRLALRVLR